MKDIGVRIRTIRRGKGITLRKAAQGADLAVSTLSNMECGRHAISLPNLLRIAKALGVPPVALLPDQFEVLQQLVPPNRRLHYHYENLDCEMLTQPSDPTGLSIFLMKFTGPSETPSAEPHRGREYVYVLEGSLEGTIDNRTRRLKAGDFAFFNADKPHRVRALGPAKVILVAFATGWLPGRR